MEAIPAVLEGSADQDLSQLLSCQPQLKFHAIRVSSCAFEINNLIRVGRKDFAGVTRLIG
jgi:hypothetical protein